MGATWVCSCNSNKHSATGCSCHNQGYSKNTTGTAGSDARTKTSFGTKSRGTSLTGGGIWDTLKTAINAELKIRSKTQITSWYSTVKSQKITKELANQIRNAIVTCGGSDVGTVGQSTIVYTWFNNVATYVNNLQAICVCNCNYCTCDCNYCTCYCNYCTCQCNYCTCNCNYCTCNCNYCPCNCNYCTCQCNYCTCQCNFCFCDNNYFCDGH